jgi:hypothetical protein
MKHAKTIAFCAVLLLVAMTIGADEKQSEREPLTFPLECANGDCPLLKGVPQTSGMRGGSVKLKPGGERGMAFHR